MIKDLPMGVHLMSLNVEKAQELWRKLREYNNRFGEDDLKDVKLFINRVFSRDTLIFEVPFGVIFLERIIPGHRAEVHISFFDHKLSAHSELMKECMIYAFMTFDLERIETYVDDYAKAVRRFLEKRLNFVHEGIMRKRFKKEGQFIDVHVYSILRDEVLGGEDGSK